MALLVSLAITTVTEATRPLALLKGTPPTVAFLLVSVTDQMVVMALLLAPLLVGSAAQMVAQVVQVDVMEAQVVVQVPLAVAQVILIWAWAVVRVGLALMARPDSAHLEVLRRAGTRTQQLASGSTLVA